MLTREGERACEVLLIAAGITLALVFQSGFPGLNQSADTGAGETDDSIILQQVWDWNIREMLRSGDPGSPFLPADSIGRTPNDTIARTAEAERRIGRC